MPIHPAQVKEHAGCSETSPEITSIQLPIVLCWGSTIHKVQGATLDQVVISFNHLQTKGHAYVAFSRVTSLQRMYLLDFKPEAIKADPCVAEEMERPAEHRPGRLVTDMVSSPEDVVSVCFFNSQSLGLTRKKDIENDHIINTSSVLAITEIWEKQRGSPIPGFVQCDSCMKRDGSGGAALFSKRSCHLTPVHLELDGRTAAIDVVSGRIQTDMDSETSIQLVVMY